VVRVGGCFVVRGDCFTGWSIGRDFIANPKLPFDPDKAQRLYNSGHTDRRIGHDLKCGSGRVRRWRVENELPANHTGKHKRTPQEMVIAGAAVAGAVLAGYKIYKKYKNKKGDDK
jgi:hypothetical protein